MPVRSLHSSVLKWPDRRTVDRRVRQWASEQAARRPDIARIGYFGSYARGDCGVGSDLDLIVVVDGAAAPFKRRAAEVDCTPLPVPCDLLVYTKTELVAATGKGRFAQVLQREVVWVYVRDAAAAGASRYENTLVLAGGDRVDFTVGCGTDGVFASDSTGIAVTIARADCGG